MKGFTCIYDTNHHTTFKRNLDVLTVNFQILMILYSDDKVTQQKVLGSEGKKKVGKPETRILFYLA